MLPTRASRCLPSNRSSGASDDVQCCENAAISWKDGRLSRQKRDSTLSTTGLPFGMSSSALTVASQAVSGSSPSSSKHFPNVIGEQ
jgi:hypothetical protein